MPGVLIEKLVEEDGCPRTRLTEAEGRNVVSEFSGRNKTRHSSTSDSGAPGKPI